MHTALIEIELTGVGLKESLDCEIHYELIKGLTGRLRPEVHKVNMIGVPTVVQTWLESFMDWDAIDDQLLAEAYDEEAA